MNKSGGQISIPELIMAEMPSMTAAEALCTLVLAAATYGEGRRNAWLTYADFQKRTMYKGTATIAKALKAVLKRGFFRRRPQGSIWEIVDGHDEDTAADELDISFSDAGPSVSEVGSSLFEEDISFSEVGSSHPEGDVSLSEADVSLSEANTVQPAANGSNIGPQTEPGSPKIEPLPFNKEKLLNGKDRERERKRAGAKCGLQVTGYKGTAHPEMPRPITISEKELAEHPATAVWLNAGMAWPGWELLEEITRRMGPDPQKETLRRARKKWMMAGFRLTNIAGILDWYDALILDPAWQPFVRRAAQAVPTAKNMNNPQSPAMAMLFKMREEIINGETTNDRGLFDHAASSLPPLGSRTTNNQNIPAFTG